MTTISKNLSQNNSSVFTSNYSNPASLTLSERYNRFIGKLEFSHFAVISMAILLGSCLGAIVAMYLFMAKMSIVLFSVGLFASLANLVACISQAPTKWVVNLFILSVVVNISLLVVALLA